MRHVLSTLLVAPMFLAGCSEDDEENVRLRVAELAEISHTAGECPMTDGLFNRKEGFTTGVMAFSIQDDENGAQIYLINNVTGPEGETLIVDGAVHEGADDNRPTQYVAGCDSGTLTLRGSIGNEKIDMDISESAGGEVAVKVGDATVEYEKSVPTGEQIREGVDEAGRQIRERLNEAGDRINEEIDEAQGQNPDQQNQNQNQNQNPAQ